MDKQKELFSKVKTYFPGLNITNLNKAYNFGVKAHADQVRDSGGPFFSHPFEVATILAKMKLDGSRHETCSQYTWTDLTILFAIV